VPRSTRALPLPVRHGPRMRARLPVADPPPVPQAPLCPPYVRLSAKHA
jgi:hypothetical protein